MHSYISDGWTKNDLEYSWYERGPVQIPGNLSLPGGFKLGGYNNSYCDVVTATGKYSRSKKVYTKENSSYFNWRRNETVKHSCLEKIIPIQARTILQ